MEKQKLDFRCILLFLVLKNQKVVDAKRKIYAVYCMVPQS